MASAKITYDGIPSTTTSSGEPLPPGHVPTPFMWTKPDPAELTLDEQQIFDGMQRGTIKTFELQKDGSMKHIRPERGE
jgi:hypothetical protein